MDIVDSNRFDLSLDKLIYLVQPEFFKKSFSVQSFQLNRNTQSERFLKLEFDDPSKIEIISTSTEPTLKKNSYYVFDLIKLFKRAKPAESLSANESIMEISAKIIYVSLNSLTNQTLIDIAESFLRNKIVSYRSSK